MVITKAVIQTVTQQFQLNYPMPLQIEKQYWLLEIEPKMGALQNASIVHFVTCLFL